MLTQSSIRQSHRVRTVTAEGNVAARLSDNYEKSVIGKRIVANLLTMATVRCHNAKCKRSDDQW